jgi:ubiquinone/menaquinone biosynthesis C-methylase UbiE
MMNRDKKTEYLRYDNRAKVLLEKETIFAEPVSKPGSAEIPLVFRQPYLFYEQCVRQYVKTDHDVLEIGSGTGLHTYVLSQTGARVVATDISSHSLKVLSQKIGSGGVETVVADMESIPVKDGSFDVVTSAGSLSYGNPDMVDQEIKRILRPGGSFICVDSLNHNPVYRFNRWLHYVKGDRSKSTLCRMPTLDRIRSISGGFEKADIYFFGSASFLMPMCIRLMGEKGASQFSETVDRLVQVRKAAFKFVLVALGKI